MSINGNTICNSFKQQLLEGKHDFSSHTFKLALYSSSASLSAATTDYTTTGEVTGTGYSAGGAALTVTAPTLSGSVALVDFSDLTFSTVTLTARGALVYNTTTDGGVGTTDAIFILDFGLDRVATAEDFTITFPTADAVNAIIRIG